MVSVDFPSIPEVTLESKVAFLRQATSFPESAYRVEAIETHMSWVFLTDEFAYKLKKPVHQALFDFRTLDARRHYCQEEVRLNRRLAERIYLGIVALSINGTGHLQLDKGGTVVDWLVKMRRLPTQHMLDYAIRTGAACADDMRRVAARLAAFYRACPPGMADPAAYRDALVLDKERNLHELGQPAYRLPAAQVRDLCRRQREVLDNRRDWFDDRVRAGRIVEGHGDLRPEHVCLAPEVAIIDCLEFSRALRTVDPADELGFLALECERLGAGELGISLLDSYSGVSGDRPSRALVHFYQSYRATLRARIAIKHLDEEKFRYSPEWRRRADDYLRLAKRHQDSISSTIDPPL
jgi:aminoglycoside phosphotransferase family enzyme